MEASECAVEIRRRLNAPPEIVFAAFADINLVSRWLTPSPEIKLVVLEFDFRVGGAYRFVYHVPGGQVMTVNGIYRLIGPPSRIVFSWNIEPPDEHAGLRTEVTVAIKAAGDGTELHIRHEQLAQDGAVERHSLGWRGALHQLAELLGNSGTVP